MTNGGTGERAGVALRDPSANVQAVPILQVAEALRRKVRRVGSADYIPCPACEDGTEKDPHCQIGGGKNLAHCHKCDWSGDVVGLVKAARSCAARDAFGWLRETFHLSGPTHRGPPPDPLVQLAQARGWSVEALKALGCTAEDGQVVFPMWDAEGKHVGDKLRRGDNQPFKVNGNETKSLTRAGTHHGLFYLRPFPTTNPTLVVEGEADAVAALSAGWPAVVGTAGAEAGKDSLKALARLLRGRECILFPDPDEAGRKWKKKVGRVLANADCAVSCVLPEEKGDLDDRLRYEQDKAKALRALIEEAYAWDDKADGKQPCAEILMEIGQQYELFQDQGGAPFAWVKGRAMPLGEKDGEFRSMLVGRYHQRTAKVANPQAVSGAMSTLAAHARTGARHPTYLRVGEHEEAIFIDLADGKGRVVKVTPRGWTVVEKSPIYWQRPGEMQPLPMPDENGDLEALRGLVNTDESGFILTVAWLLGALRPNQPYPILVILGEQGSGKSNETRLLRSLIDPFGLDGRAISAPPRKAESLVAAAKHQHVVALDNVGYLPPWLPDLFCCLSTGAAWMDRRLYTNVGLLVTSLRRPLVINSIARIVNRGDLLDRGLFVELSILEDSKRLSERDYWDRVEKRRARIFGGLLNALSTGLKRLPDIELREVPRMADFAELIVAAEPALPWGEGDFVKTYRSNRQEAVASLLDTDAVATAIRELVKVERGFCGTPSRLWEKMKSYLGDPGSVKGVRGLGKRLRGLAPGLRKEGIVITFPRGKEREVVIKGVALKNGVASTEKQQPLPMPNPQRDPVPF